MRDRGYRLKEERDHKNREIRKMKDWHMFSNKEIDGTLVGKFASVHGSVCSCEMCGNPRKHFGEVSTQEKKFVENAEDQMLGEKVVDADDRDIEVEDYNDYCNGVPAEIIIQTRYEE